VNTLVVITGSRPPPERCKECGGKIESITADLAFCRGEGEHTYIFRDNRWWLEEEYENRGRVTADATVIPSK